MARSLSFARAAAPSQDSKHQAPRTKSQTSTNDQAPMTNTDSLAIRSLEISHSNLFEVWSLRFGASRGRSGFTLVELLVVIAIIGVLVALLLPAPLAPRVKVVPPARR